MTLNPLKSSVLYSVIVSSIILIVTTCLPIWSSEFNEGGDFWSAYSTFIHYVTYDPSQMRDGDGTKPGFLEILSVNGGFLVRLGAIIGGGILLGQLLYALAGKKGQSEKDDEYLGEDSDGSGVP